MPADPHATFMEQAVRRAHRARHRTSPNPRVGCVIVSDGLVVGAGVTRPAGGRHAEVEAILAAGGLARGADMYVTLEPCCHHGRTPPCTEAIIEAGLRRVFVGVADPNPLVGGGGLAALRAAGIEVQLGVLGQRCAEAHAPFFRFITQRRPWVILKAAVSLDGRIATQGGDSKWITGPAARRDVHRLRARVDAVMVGVGTAKADDPQLTVRDAPGQDPRRVVADTDLSLPPTARLLGPGGLVLHAADADPARIRAIAATGAELAAVDRSGRGLDVAAMLHALADRDIVRLLVEGGGRLHGSLLQRSLVDEAVIYVAPRLLGRGRPVVDIPSVSSVRGGWILEAPDVRRFGPDVRIHGRVGYPTVAEVR